MQNRNRLSGKWLAWILVSVSALYVLSIPLLMWYVHEMGSSDSPQKRAVVAYQAPYAFVYDCAPEPFQRVLRQYAF